MDVLTTPFLTGTATGAILLLAALGLTLTFGQMGVINMANGEFLMVGAYVAYLTQQVVSAAGLSIVIALPAAFIVAGLLGLLLELSIIQWMYQRPLDTLLATVGVSLVLQQFAQDLFGAQGDPVTAPSWLGGRISVFGYEWPHRQLFTILLALAALGALSAVLKYSFFGRQIRATVQNRQLAETLGVSTRNVDRITFFLGSGLAGVGGVAIARRTSSRHSSSWSSGVSGSSRAPCWRHGPSAWSPPT
jgi:urea transport system permease protein